MPRSWGAAIREYSTHLIAAQKSSGTVTVYRHYLDRARPHLRADPWAVDVRDLERLIAHPEWGVNARKSMRSAVVGFYRWAYRRRYIAVDITVDLPGVKVPRGVPRPAPADAIATALRSAAPRERLMIRLATFGGLRAAEIAQVHTRDLLGDVLVVHGKGRKERLVPIDDDELIAAISAADGWLFPSPYRAGRGHLTPNHVSKLIAALLPGHWTAHPLRHRYASVMYDETGDIFAVSRLLGHESTVTTQVYVDLPMRHLRRAATAAAARHDPVLAAA